MSLGYFIFMMVLGIACIIYNSWCYVRTFKITKGKSDMLAIANIVLSVSTMIMIINSFIKN